jgi:hypothetical protein
VRSFWIAASQAELSLSGFPALLEDYLDQRSEEENQQRSSAIEKSLIAYISDNEHGTGGGIGDGRLKLKKRGRPPKKSGNCC